jgi:DNA-binding transcriptional MerR regulator
MSDEIMENVEETVDSPVETQSEKTFTQSDVERLIEQRLMRERKKYEKKMEGIDLDEARQLMQEKEAAEIERQKEKGEFEKVLQQLAEKKDQQINALNTKLHETLVDGALLKAASSQNAVAPDQVVALLKNKVKLADDGTVEVLDDSGTARYTDDGIPMTVDSLVSDYLTANPHFVRASSGGTGSQGAAGGSTQKPLSVADMVANWETGGREAFAAMKGKR